MASDAESVVDTRLRFNGIKGLRVVDNSSMPTIILSNTNVVSNNDRRKGCRHDPRGPRVRKLIFFAKLFNFKATTQMCRKGASNPLMGDRLTVGLRTLTPSIQVRILVPQLFRLWLRLGR